MGADKYQPRASVRESRYVGFTPAGTISENRVDYFYGSLIDKQGKGPRSVDSFELHFSAIYEENQILEVVDCRFAFEGPN